MDLLPGAVLFAGFHNLELSLEPSLYFFGMSSGYEVNRARFQKAIE